VALPSTPPPKTLTLPFTPLSNPITNHSSTPPSLRHPPLRPDRPSASSVDRPGARPAQRLPSSRASGARAEERAVMIRRLPVRGTRAGGGASHRRRVGRRARSEVVGGMSIWVNRGGMKGSRLTRKAGHDLVRFLPFSCLSLSLSLFSRLNAELQSSLFSSRPFHESPSEEIHTSHDKPISFCALPPSSESLRRLYLMPLSSHRIPPSIPLSSVLTLLSKHISLLIDSIHLIIYDPLLLSSRAPHPMYQLFFSPP
jgi:hypothetical protein